MPVDPYKAVCEAVSEIAAAIRAIAVSPVDNVFVPRKLFTMVQVLSLTPPDMWLSKEELHKNFDAEYRAAFPEKEESS